MKTEQRLLSRQQKGTIQYLINEYRDELRKVLESYLVSTPAKQMCDAVSEVNTKYQARCEKIGIEWSDVLNVLDAEVGYSTNNVTRFVTK